MSHTQFYPLNPWFPKLLSYDITPSWFNGIQHVSKKIISDAVWVIYSSAPWIILIDCEKRRRQLLADGWPRWPTGWLGVGSTRSSWQPVDCSIGVPFRLYLDTIACFDNFGCSGLKETPDQNQVNRVVKITRPFSKSVKKMVRRTPRALAGISLDPVQRLVKTGSRDCFLFCSKCSTAEAERYQIAIFETAVGSLYSLQPNQTLYQATFYNVHV